MAKRLNIDFTIGIGYLRGEYKEYKPIDGCYVWQATKMRNWIGPTKAEISLVWLIGHKNCNEKKGGSQRKNFVIWCGRQSGTVSFLSIV